MPQRAYTWIRDHPVAADGLLGALLFAGSSAQLASSSASAAAAAAMVNVLLALAVAVRRRWTAAAFVSAAVIGLAQACFGFSSTGGAPVRALQPTVTDAAVLVLLYTLAARRPRRASLAGLALCLAGAVIAIGGWTFASHSAGLLLLAVAALGGTFGITWLLGDYAAHRRTYYVALEERLAAAERARDQEDKRAEAVELSAARLRRIERDLHDGAQVRLTALAMTLGELKEALAGSGGPAGSPDDGLALAAAAHQAAKDTLSELRSLARGIHPPVLDQGLAAALASLAETSVVPVDLNVALAGRLSPGCESAVYFSVAELLANAAKHSGAGSVTVTVRQAAAAVAVTVADDGAGGARVTDGGGLAGLRERLRTVDGRLGIDSPAGGPTVITIELPGHH